MLTLDIKKDVIIAGQEYKAGDKVTVNQTMIHKEVTAVPSSLQVLIDGGLIEAVAGHADIYKVKGDILVNVVGREYVKGEEFEYHEVADYVDDIEDPEWIADGITDGLWAIDDGKIHVTGVTMSDATISLDVGANKTLTADVLPAGATDKTGVWASSDATVATVDQAGKVVGVKAGTANITFTTTDGAKKGTTVATITVAVVVPTSVSVSPASPTCAVGATVKLSASITPASATDKTGVWASADETVATVDQTGLVTGVKAGTSAVSFTTNSGNKSANRTVTVTTP